MTRVLIVDDDPVIRTITSMALKRDGWETVEAASAEEALAKYSADFSIVLLDLMMPKMDGRQLFAALQEQDPDVRAAFITARHDLDHELKGLGAVGVLRKPYDAASLGAQLRALLD